MGKLKSILGYIWAIVALIIAFATFFGNNYFSRGFAAATGITVNPWYSGGEIIKTIAHGTYKTSVHRAVFDYLIGETKEGFIQLNWEPSAGLPPLIWESIDYNGDGKEDFAITFNTVTGEGRLAANNPAVLSIGKSYRLRNGWAVRVLLQRQP
jgi:hypothetical protein